MKDNVETYTFNINSHTKAYDLCNSVCEGSNCYVYEDVADNSIYKWLENTHWCCTDESELNNENVVYIPIVRNKNIYSERANGSKRFDWTKKIPERNTPFITEKELLTESMANIMYRKQYEVVEKQSEYILHSINVTVNWDKLQITLTEDYGSVDIRVFADKTTKPDIYSRIRTYSLSEMKVNDEYTEGKKYYDILPENIVDFLMKKFNKLRNKWAGREISVNSEITGLEYIEAATVYPYEPNLFFISNDYKLYDFLHSIKTNDPEGYNKYCRNLNVKSFPSLRKLYLRKPEAIYAYSILKLAGFKDVNIIMKLLDREDYSRIIDAEDELIAFMKEYLMRKSEASAARFIYKFKTMEYYDSLHIFCTYRDKIANSIVDEIMKDGFTSYNHDVLAKLSQILEDGKITFEYTQQQLQYECKIGDYEFIIPRTSEELIDLGIEMHNCVASYCDKVIKKKSLIVYAKKNGRKVICIEMRDKKVPQAFEERNKPLGKESDEVMREWMDRYNLTGTYL